MDRILLPFIGPLVLRLNFFTLQLYNCGLDPDYAVHDIYLADRTQRGRYVPLLGQISRATLSRIRLAYQAMLELLWISYGIRTSGGDI